MLLLNMWFLHKFRVKYIIRNYFLAIFLPAFREYFVNMGFAEDFEEVV
jgi:hypothetical protein